MKDEEIYMTVKIDAKVLGIKKPIEVNETNKNLKKTLKVQIKLEKLSKIDAENMSNEEAYDAFLSGKLEATDATIEFIADILKLTEPQADKLEDIEPDETDELFGQIIQKIMHIDDEDGEDDSDTPSDTADVSGDAR
ncbi:tail protein [Lactobacillus phage SA-C12]|uniref:Tail assembly chaperone n=1 Tax=Lactobacillus phage SA-C12 TaxID=1755697 RepID=A0A1I9KK69_9CAUD|nr:tail protein [Lactobacillus phage SA-C12]ALY06838.1 tail assembly chaperone [Lactobacillus phage SA-C12]